MMKKLFPLLLFFVPAISVIAASTVIGASDNQKLKCKQIAGSRDLICQQIHNNYLNHYKCNSFQSESLEPEVAE